MKKTFEELVAAIDNFDNNYDYGQTFDIEEYNAAREPLTDALNEWHNSQRIYA